MDPILFPELAPPAVQPGRVFVYIAQSFDRALYVGCANNIARRLSQHRSGRGAKFTRDHGPPKLVHVEGPMDLEAAVQRESQLKRWSRAKKEALIEADLNKLHALSRSRQTATRLHTSRG